MICVLHMCCTWLLLFVDYIYVKINHFLLLPIFHNHSLLLFLFKKVGRRAQDNDLLSCSPQYRDDTDAWLHVAHSPGSHVIIRCSGRPISSLPETTIYDAAALAVRYSKSWREDEQDDDMSCFLTEDNKIPVHLTTCQNIQKPFGAKPGLVQIITGPYQTIAISPRECLDRLIRLDTTLDKYSPSPSQST
jgi:NFACT protein RNA binding domain